MPSHPHLKGEDQFKETFDAYLPAKKTTLCDSIML